MLQEGSEIRLVMKGKKMTGSVDFDATEMDGFPAEEMGELYEVGRETEEYDPVEEYGGEEDEMDFAGGKHIVG